MDTRGKNTRGSNDGDGPGPDGQTPEAAQAADRMRRAIMAALDGGVARQELEGAARDLVCTLRAANQTPEETLVHIKQVLAEAGLRPTYANDSTKPAGVAAEVYRDVITWSIRHYYEGRENRENENSAGS